MPRSDEAQNLWMSYAAGLGHSTLLRLKSMLINRDHEGAARVAHEGIELIEKAIFGDEKGPKK